MATAQQPITLGEFAHGAIAKYLKQAIAYEKPVKADTDPENLHQMRVGLRRLRTAIEVFDVGLELPRAGRKTKVAAIARTLGELRDLDVVGATLRDRYAPDLPDPEQACLGAVLLTLARQRHKTFKRVKKLLKGDRYGDLKQALRQWLKEPVYGAIATLPAEQVLPDLILPLVSQLWLHPAWLVGTKTINKGTTKGSAKRVSANTRLSQAATDQLIAEQGPLLHDLRKQVKRVRYQLRLVADLYPSALDADIDRLSTMQDTLGDLQDSTVLAAFVESVVPDARAQMPRFFALLADSRHRAWKQWQTHQQFYLDPAQRLRLRLALLHPGTPTQAPSAPADKSPPGAAKSPSRRRTTKDKPTPPAP
jgi:CHAD domain-containing protein